MIKEFKTYHGAVFVRLIQGLKKVLIGIYPTKSNCSYVIDGKIGFYIKYSKKRLTPWTFTFSRVHQKEIQKMKEQLEEVFVILVCDTDGICCLSYSELKEILDENYEDIENISIHRGAREKYQARGRDGIMKLKIRDSDFPKKVKAAIKKTKKIFNW